MSLYNEHKYAQALSSLQSALIANPEFEEANALYPIVFNEGTAYYKDVISANESQSDPDALDTVYFTYKELQDLHRTAKGSGRAGLVIEDFAKQVEEARIKAADAYFASAERLEAEDDWDSMKKAVEHYEKAKSRKPGIPGIDERIKAAIEKATRTLMVFGYSEETKEVNEALFQSIKDSLSKNRFVVVSRIPDEDYQDMIGSKNPEKIATMYAKAEGVDYLLSVTDSKEFKKIDKEESVYLPYELPLFKGKKISIGYTVQRTLDYRLIDLQSSRNTVVQEDTISNMYESPVFTVSFAKAEGVKEFNDGVTKANCCYVTLPASATHEQANQAFGKLMRTTSNIMSMQSIPDPTKMMQWIDYYNTWYFTLDKMVEDFGGQQMFYEPEVIFNADQKSYYTIGSNLADAKEKSSIRVAVLNARLKRARAIVKTNQKVEAGVFLEEEAQQLGQVLMELF